MRLPRHFHVLVIVLALGAAACGSQTTTVDTAESADQSADDGTVSSVDGTWRMVAFLDEEVDVDTNTAVVPELEFSDGLVLGNFGCNDGGGDYEQTGDSILFSNIAAQEAGCPRPDGQAGLVPTETLLLQLFNSGQPVALEIDGAFMSWSQDDVLLSFELVSE